MTWVHVVRGLYLLVSVAVALTAAWRSGMATRAQDRVAGFALTTYALSTASAQAYAFNKPLTLGTLYVGFGVAGGLAWLVSIPVLRERTSR